MVSPPGRWLSSYITHRKLAMFTNTPVRADRSLDDGMAVTIRWSADIIRGRKVEHVGTVEAGSQREAYAAAIEKFTVPIERQNRLFVAKLKTD